MVEIMEEEITKPSYYAVIPANVRYDKRLSSLEKLLYGEITCLTNKNGFCFATSNYFAGLYDCSRENISRCISHLAQLGYIKVIIERNFKRKIFICMQECDKNTAEGA